MNKILIVSDISCNQINGVKTTLKNTILNLISMGYDVTHINPDINIFNKIPIPFYKEIELVTNPKDIEKLIEDINPTSIHISTEGPLGITTKLYCDKMNYGYTTAIHTNFDDFLYKMAYVPKFISRLYMKWFHKKSKCIMVPTVDILNKYKDLGFKNLIVWSRGVDTNLFSYNKRIINSDKEILLYVGRISKEKNIEEFLEMNFDFPHIKLIVGDGPELENLKKKYNAFNIIFHGPATGEELATLYANSDIFVFPSKTDTFGVVLLEAMASGLPIAAYDEPGPKFLIEQGVNGYYSDNLKENIIKCKDLVWMKWEICNMSKKYSWTNCTKTFVNNLVYK